MTVATKEAPAAAAPAAAQPTADARSSSRPPPHAHESSGSDKRQHKGKRGKRRTAAGATLLLAALAALVAAVAIPRAANDERVRAAVSDGLDKLNSTLVEQFDVRLDGFLERLANLSDTVNSIIGDDGPRPGLVAAAAGLQAHHPVIIIPGFVTSGLELWNGEPCAADYFRQRLWGKLSMAQTLLADRACWLRHMKLDPVTGSDPPHIKVRAAKSLEAIDYFVPGYWVFSKMVQSLADLGYDNNRLIAVPYDWRLPLGVMEARDGFFTRVKAEAELQMKLYDGVKPVVVSHSYGAVVTLTFLDWVERKEPGWVDRHLHAYVNLAGPLLGLPKALSPLLSGETRETVDMMAGLAVLVEQYLGKQTRAALFRTWGSVMAMLPVGGSKVWGNVTHAPDDDDAIRAAGRSFGGIIARVTSADALLGSAVRNNDSSELSSEGLSLLTQTLHNWGAKIKQLGGHDDDDNDGSDGGIDGGEDGGSDGNGSGTGSGGKAGSSGGKAGDGDKRKRWLLGALGKAGKPERSREGGGATLEEVERSAAQQVRFMDVSEAITAVAMTAGEQMTLNLQRWSAAAAELDLSGVLEHHRLALSQLAEAAAAQRGQQCSAAPGDGTAGSCAAAAADETQQAQEQPAEAAEAAVEETGGSSAADDAAVAAAGLGATAADAAAGNGSVDVSAVRQAQQEEAERLAQKVRPVNPVRTPLPKAPKFKLYCFYGIGTPTERGYHYLRTTRNGMTEWSVNSVADDPASGLLSGVQLSPDGDGTVPLLSLGALCAGGWKTKRLNPSGLEVVVREYPHNPGSLLKDARGGPGASTHVELLGNEAMLMDLLAILAGQGGNVTEQYHTDIRNIAAKIPWDEL